MVSLIILLVLTLIGLSSMESSVMNEKMAANSQISTTAFQAAETAIRERYFAEKTNIGMAYEHANAGTTSDCVNCDVHSSSTEMVIPESAQKVNGVPCGNNSMGVGRSMIGQGVEIIGTATHRGIVETNAQGYTLCPMRGS